MSDGANVVSIGLARAKEKALSASAKRAQAIATYLAVSTPDFSNTQSIVAWYDIHPRRHGPQLGVFKKIWPRYAQAITEAGLIIRERNNKQGQANNG